MKIELFCSENMRAITMAICLACSLVWLRQFLWNQLWRNCICSFCCSVELSCWAFSEIFWVIIGY